MINVQCPICGEKLAVRSEYVGRRVRCGKCQQPFEAKAATPLGEPEVVDAIVLPTPPPLELPVLPDQFAEAPVARRAAGGLPRTGPAARQDNVRRTNVQEREPAPRVVNLWLAVGIPVACLLIGGAILAAVLISAGRPEPEPPVAADGLGPPAKEKRALAPAPAVAARQSLLIETNALLFDPFRGHLYAAVSATAAKDANSIVAIDPATGATVWSVNVGSNPNVLALSENGAVLWIGLKGASAIQRLDLNTRVAGPLLDLGRGGFGATYAEQIVVLPGTTDSVAVSLFRPGISPRHDGVAIYDNGVRRPRKTQDHTGSNRLVLSDRRDTLIGYNNETTEFGLRRLKVMPDGVMEERPIAERVVEGFGVDLLFADGRIWCTSGVVVDVRTMTRVGTIPAKGALAVDVPGKRIYYLDRDRRVLEVFATDTLARIASRPLDLDGTAGHLTNLAGTALAYRTDRQVIILPTRDLR